MRTDRNVASKFADKGKAPRDARILDSIGKIRPQAHNANYLNAICGVDGLSPFADEVTK